MRKTITDHYAEQKRRVCVFVKRNQTAFLKLCLADALVKLMKSQDFESISVSAICATADVGRTTFYRHFGNKDSKEVLLVFKIIYEWECYAELREEEVKEDRGFALTNYVYENRELFSLLNRHGLITAIMRAFDSLMPMNETSSKSQSYLMSFFTYGYFGIIHRWMQYDFDETPDQLQKHVLDTLLSRVS
ncbi:TetR/AcrR family transcriptional regulator [Raoultibacter phocaeensis]|uniref:TetR/AcrR family transcriptional regulator n=1 Tax=Raoultibacter phocaeensis TaxID=2479841 RepID=UPI001119DC2A|nr:TetR/AcrR family transcriptional regulator [Raoultibacter phocaeensis]